MPLCGAALTFFAAAKKVSKESGLTPPAHKRVPWLGGGSGASGIRALAHSTFVTRQSYLPPRAARSPERFASNPWLRFREADLRLRLGEPPNGTAGSPYPLRIGAALPQGFVPHESLLRPHLRGDGADRPARDRGEAVSARAGSMSARVQMAALNEGRRQRVTMAIGPKARAAAPDKRGGEIWRLVIERPRRRAQRRRKNDCLVTSVECAREQIPDAPLPPPSQGTRL